MDVQLRVWKFCVIACLCLHAVPGSASDEGSRLVSQKVTTSEVLPAGSPEAVALLKWLAANAMQSVSGNRLLDRSKLGDFWTTHSTTAGAGSRGDAEEAPRHPPQVGTSGDTYSISTCSEQALQEWAFDWSGEGTGWQARSYSAKLVHECPASP